jgi:uncharacterized protein YdhG (YjbR/CyaY superfamily)
MSNQLTSSVRFISVEDYFASIEGSRRVYLEQLRDIIQEVIPNAESCIRYNMPAFYHDGVIVYYAAYKKHLGLYPTAGPIMELKSELTNYKSSKGAIQFPYDTLPKQLIQRVVRTRLRQMQETLNS